MLGGREHTASGSGAAGEQGSRNRDLRMDDDLAVVARHPRAAAATAADLDGEQCRQRLAWGSGEPLKVAEGRAALA